MTTRRWVLLIVGAAMCLAGGFALFVPVSIDSHDRWGFQITCGTGYQTNSSQANLADTDGSGRPSPGRSSTAECTDALSTRRWWATSVAGVGGAVVAVELGMLALSDLKTDTRKSLLRGRIGPSLRSEIVSVTAYLSLRLPAQLVPANKVGVTLCRLNLRVMCLASRTVRGTRIEGVRGSISGEWVRAPGAQAANGVVLLLHGSGFIACSPRTHRGFASHISMQSGLPVFVSRYRLAPEHRFPAAHDDAMAAYRWLLDELGFDPEKIVVVGDSAGGHLAIALALRARTEGLPRPAALTLFGPLIDPSFRTAMADQRTRRSPINPATGRRFVSLYVGSHDVEDPRLSLLHAAVDGLPPIQLHYGTVEVMRAEAELFTAHVIDAGGSCQPCVWPNLVHGYWLFPQFTPEARASIRVAGQFIAHAVRPTAATAEHPDDRRQPPSREPPCPPAGAIPSVEESDVLHRLLNYNVSVAALSESLPSLGSSPTPRRRLTPNTSCKQLLRDVTHTR